MRKKKALLKLAEVKETFFVRIELNQERVEHFVDLIKSKVKLPPIKVSEEEYELVDGRHRKAAYEQVGISAVECELKKFTSRTDMIVEALCDNVGGSLPPTPDDITHTMQLLLVAGESRKAIVEKMSDLVGFPPRMVRDYLDKIQSDLSKAKMGKAEAAVVNKGKTVEEAALEYGVKLESLRKRLAGKTKDDRATDTQQAKAWFGAKFKNLSYSSAQSLSKLLRDLKDGLVTPEDAQEVLEYINRLLGRLQKINTDWNKRFAAVTGTTEKLVENSQIKVHARRARRAKSALELMGLGV